MKIEIELPDFVSNDARLLVLSGVNTVARKKPGEPWEIKSGQCSMCGRCCPNCDHLEPYASGYQCGLKLMFPYRCMIVSGVDLGIKECTATWKTIE